MTNAEKLSKETDLLAEMIKEYALLDCFDCPAQEECDKSYEKDCHDFLVWWLEQEAEEDGSN